jgi:SAM-dependent methyltransferase
MTEMQTRIQIPKGYDEILLDQRGLGVTADDNSTILRHYWRETDLVAKHMNPEIKNILDIGCGFGFAMMMLFERFPRPDLKIYLFDHDYVGENLEQREFRKLHQYFYNSFECTRTVLRTAGLPEENFIFVSAEKENLEKLPKMDIICSFASWGWHYPIDLYSAEVKNLVKPGSVVITDVRCDEMAGFNAPKDILNGICRSEPEVLHTFKGYKAPPHEKLPKNYGMPVNNPIKGQRLLWKVPAEEKSARTDSSC